MQPSCHNALQQVSYWDAKKCFVNKFGHSCGKRSLTGNRIWSDIAGTISPGVFFPFKIAEFKQDDIGADFCQIFWQNISTILSSTFLRAIDSRLTSIFESFISVFPCFRLLSMLSKVLNGCIRSDAVPRAFADWTAKRLDPGLKSLYYGLTSSQ